MTKACSRCHAVRPLNEFNKNRAQYKGYSHYCRDCMKVWKWIYRERYRKQRNAYQRLYRRLRPDLYSACRRRYVEKGGLHANIVVLKMVGDGCLPNLKKTFIPCADCHIERAIRYDHRDYDKPAEVEPVCNRCNILRGAALPWRGNAKVSDDR